MSSSLVKSNYRNLSTVESRPLLSGHLRSGKQGPSGSAAEAWQQVGEVDGGAVRLRVSPESSSAYSATAKKEDRIERPAHQLKELLVGFLKELVEFLQDGRRHVRPVVKDLGVVRQHPLRGVSEDEQQLGVRVHLMDALGDFAGGEVGWRLLHRQLVWEGVGHLAKVPFGWPAVPLSAGNEVGGGGGPSSAVGLEGTGGDCIAKSSSPRSTAAMREVLTLEDFSLAKAPKLRIPRCAVPPGLFRAHTRVASDAADHNFTGASPPCVPEPDCPPRATPPPVTGAVVMLWYLAEIRLLVGAMRGEECGMKREGEEAWSSVVMPHHAR
ncbi:hypothetical protein EYF80_016728 [Liparis tanakae]|uniref:Uncharacterized protein n=1 Tax=Liparis tanakae TaxID=230148 RepID=A0A4Z2I517_9TELE|nr:hypothetical protein EYF80_016728 [Liparis tanakae]